MVLINWLNGPDSNWINLAAAKIRT